MAGRKQEKFQEFRSFVNYIDVLTYALALSDRDKFDADPNKWHKAVFQICQTYKHQIPELKLIYFTDRPPLPPQSTQVDRLIKVLNMSHEVSLPNPRYPTVNMDNSKKENIIKREEGRLAKYKGPIEGIKKILEAEVSANA